MRFVIEIERKKFTCSLVQSWISTPPPIAIAAARDSLGAAYMSVRCRRIPVTASPMRSSFAASCMADDGDAPIIFIHADGEYSGNLESAHSRYHAERRDIAQGHDQHDAIADLGAEFFRQRRCPESPYSCPAVRSAKCPLTRCGAKSTTRDSAAGKMPRNCTPDDLSPWVISPCSSM